MPRAPRLADIIPAYRPPLVRDRAGLMAEIGRSWRDLDGVVRRLDERALRAPVPGLGEGAETWEVMHVIAHLAAWKRNAAAIAREQADLANPPRNGFPGQLLGFRTDAFNAGLMQEWRGRSPAEAMEEHADAHAALLEVLESVPEERLLRRGRSVLWLTPAIGHPRAHLRDIGRALGADEVGR